MSNISYTDKDKTIIDGIKNKWRDVDANEVKNVVNTNAPSSVTFNAAIPFDKGLSIMVTYTVTGAVVFTINSTNAQAGFRARLRVTANGINLPDLTAFKKIGLGSFINVAGRINILDFLFDGVDYLVTISQPSPVVATTPPMPGIFLQNAGNSHHILLHDIPVGSLNDSIVPFTRVGAALSGTLSKVGAYDKISITGGDYTNSYITYDANIIGDIAPIIRLKVKVANLNKDGTTGTSYLGVGRHGLGGLFQFDTSAPFDGSMSLDLVSGAIVGRQGFGGNTTAGMTIQGSGETLMSSGDILELEYQLDALRGYSYLKVFNKKNGAYVIARPSSSLSPTGGGLCNCAIKLIMSNADFTILSLTAESQTPYKPLLYIVGDSMCNGFNTNIQDGLLGQFLKDEPFSVACTGGNAAYLHSIANFQLPEVIRSRPTYVLCMSILAAYQGHFQAGNANNADFLSVWAKINNAIVALGAVPIWPKWPGNAGTNGNGAAWNTYLDTQVIAYPTMKILDLSVLTLDFAATFGHFSTSDYIIVKKAIMDLLRTLGIN